MSILFRVKTIIAHLAWKLFPDYMAGRRLKKMQNGTRIIIHPDYDFLPHIMENCQYFLTKEQLSDKHFMHKTCRDIVKCYYLYGTNANEYFCYKFPQKSARARATYLPRLKKDTMLVQQMKGQHEHFFGQIKDKNIFYEMAKPFFGREACRVESFGDLKAFAAFVAHHPKFIAKPTRGGCGKGIEILNMEDFENKVETAFNYLREEDSSYIVEEIVEQDSRIAVWNSSSLNTIRVPSMRTKNGVVIFYPSIRIGRAGSIVDNAGAGGTFAAIDPKTGLIISDGFDKRGHTYKEHPDSHKPYKGEQIPDWDKLVETVHRMHESMPKEHKYIAYDMALSTKGWVVVEANWGELSMPQVEFGKGLYNEFKSLLES